MRASLTRSPADLSLPGTFRRRGTHTGQDECMSQDEQVGRLNFIRRGAEDEALKERSR